jgi:hypothetical protein
LSGLLSVGRRFSRACLLCFGAALVLIAVVGLAGNVPTIRDGDWKPSELSALYAQLSEYAVVGSFLLIVAYGIYTSKRWGSYIAALAAFSCLALIAKAWLEERSDPDAAIVFLIPGLPMALIFAWALAEVKRDMRHRTSEHEERGHEIG